jgi:hypothetical protein
MPFIIIDLRRSTKEMPMFWRDNDMGYTTSPLEAGIYSDQRVLDNWSYYNDGVETIAIELNSKGLDSIDLKVSVSWSSEKALALCH